MKKFIEYKSKIKRISRKIDKWYKRETVNNHG